MIELKNIYKSFNGNIVLNNLSLEVTPTFLWSFRSEWSWKIYLNNMLLGFLDQDSGIVNMKDNKDSTVIRKDSIGYIPENVNLYPYLTGVENLDYFSKIAGLKFTTDQLYNFLLECGLNELDFNKPISEYSKGMRQKVGIAIAYAKRAKVYLLDEPASGLDPLSSNELTLLLKKMSSNGSTILMASHDIFRVRETCHKIGILKNGKLVKEMLSSEVSSSELESIYLNYMNS